MASTSELFCTRYSCHKGSSSSQNNLVEEITQKPPSESLVASTVEDKEMISKMIRTTMPQLKVTEIQTVKNSFLEAMYLLKKEEYKSRYGKEPEERLLYHVTSASNVNSIMSDNFDWRRITRGKFGLGTSFSGDAEYANHYANYDIGEERAIIITNVLICKTTPGYGNMNIPHEKFDTTMGNGDKVYVKFCDNEILPKYIVYYRSSVSRNRHYDYDAMFEDFIDEFVTDLYECETSLDDSLDEWLDDYDLC